MDPSRTARSSRPHRLLGGGLRLGRIAGVELVLDWSLLIVFWLVAFGLAAGVLPRWHPDWSAAICWVVALGAAALFLFSVLLHELAHALVARACHVPVSRITLFVFGGLAHLRDEPPSAGAEFLIVAAGPLTSIVIGLLALAVGSALAAARLAFSAQEPAAGLRLAGPAATLLLWLGPVNLLLGLFNLVPGYPLDGGRLLRALIWAATGDLVKATRWASMVGRGFAWLLMGIGVAMALGLQVPPFGSGFVNGLWLVFIGWFLGNAAIAGYEAVLQRQALRGVPIARLMSSRFERVPPELSVQRLVEEGILQSDQRSFLVLDGDRLVGLVSLDDVRRLPRALWPNTTVREIMTGADQLVTVPPEQDAMRAMSELSERGVNQLPVVEDGRVLGVVRRQDFVRWLSLLSPAEGTG